jgi:hypothetical protein
MAAYSLNLVPVANGGLFYAKPSRAAFSRASVQHPQSLAASLRARSAGLDRGSERSQHRTVGAGDRGASWDRFSGCALEDAFTRWQDMRMGEPGPKP